MFVFDNSEDLDIATYEYRLYTADQVDTDPDNAGYFILNDNVSIDSGTITPYRQGFNLSNIFTVAVENSTTTSTTSVTSPIFYFGAVRAIDTSANPSPWTLITITDDSTPLIDEEFIGSLTAAKITAGTIGAHEIILTQPGTPTVYTAPANVSVLRSSNYVAGSGGAGWLIRGDGFAEFDSTNIRGSISAASINLNTHNYWLPNSGTPIFKVGSSSKNFAWDGTNLTTTGTIITGATVSGGTVGGISTSTDKLFIGTGTYNNTNTAFYVDNNGNFSLKDKLSWDGTTLTIQGAITATSGTFNGRLQAGDIYIPNTSSPVFSVTTAGTVTATSGTIGGWTLSSTNLSSSYAFSDIFETITGSMTLSNNGSLTSSYSFAGIINSYNTTVRINDYSPAGQGSITVEGNASGSPSKFLYSASGPFNISDSRLKNIMNLTVDGLNILNKVNVVKFNYKNDENQKEHIGFIAQQVYEHIPESAFPGGEDEKVHPWMMSRESLIPYLVRSIQQLSQKVDELESRLV
jgi:hypothetical protein